MTAAVTSTLERGAFLITWASLTTAAPTGDSIERAASTDRSVQVTGNFGTGGVVRMEGSNDGVNYIILTDGQGNAIQFTAEGIEAIIEATRYIRPRVSAGTGVNVAVFLYAKD